MRTRKAGNGLLALALGCALTAALASSVQAGVVVYDKDGKKIEIGGRVQVEYANVDTDDGESRDRIFFRRLRPYIAGTVTENWYGKIQFDFGEAEDAEEVKVGPLRVKGNGRRRPGRRWRRARRRGGPRPPRVRSPGPQPSGSSKR